MTTSSYLFSQYDRLWSGGITSILSADGLKVTYRLLLFIVSEYGQAALSIGMVTASFSGIDSIHVVWMDAIFVTSLL